MKSKTPHSWLFKMAWRDARASITRLLLFMGSIILGIAAVVSIQSFSDNLENNIALQSRSLMGADYLIDSDAPANEQVNRIMDSLGGYDAMEVKFASMAAFPKGGQTKFVQVRSMSGSFPFYGQLETEPASAAQAYLNQEGALVDATVMTQFNLVPGDSVKLGTRSFEITGALLNAPGSTALSTSVAPPIMVPHSAILKSGLLQKGSRLRYNYYFEDDSADLEALDEAIDPKLDREDADLDTHLATSQRLGRRYNNVGRFLNLVAFIALLLGCVGIASSVHIYIKEKLRSVAVLKCLGASRKQSFFIFLIQITGMGLVGGIIGTALGLLLQQAFPLILREFLPFDVVISTSFEAIAIGLVLGLGMAVLFALAPLVNTWFVSPLQVLRVQEGSDSRARKIQIVLLGMVVLFVWLFAYWLLENLRYAAAFVLGVLVTFAILGGTAQALMKGINYFFPKDWSFASRQSLRNLYRPNNQTLVLVLAIGIGSFLISTLYFTKDFLLAKAALEDSGKSPNMIMFDVQSAQRIPLANIIRPKGLPILDDIPIVTMRMEKIKGRSVDAIREDSTSTMNRWILNHEFRVTYRDSLMASESLLEGQMGAKSYDGGIIPISLSDNVARDANLVVGDTLVFDVQGVIMQTIVGSIRQVDWGQLQMNFSLVFPTGVLEKAPQFHVLTTNVPDQSTAASLQQEVVRRFPNVSILDLRQVLGLIEGVLDKISWVISFMAFFSIFTGVIVLIGSIRNSKYQRIKESVLLRTLGAKSGQIFKITALEYVFLGVLGSGMGVLLSLFGSQLLALYVFETAFVPSWIPFLVVLPGISLLVFAIGVLNNRSVLREPPLQVLRKTL